MADKTPLKNNKNEIIWNLINSGLAGSLVFLGAFVSSGITLRGIIAALIASGIVAVTKFYDYWKTQEGEYTSKLFTFVR